MSDVNNKVLESVLGCLSYCLGVIENHTKKHKNLWLSLSLSVFLAALIWVGYWGEGFPVLKKNVMHLWGALIGASLLIILLNGARFWLLLNMIGNPMRFFMALEVTLISTAANLLPVPAGMLIRLAHLKGSSRGSKAGVSYLLASMLLSVSVGSILFSIALFQYWFGVAITAGLAAISLFLLSVVLFLKLKAPIAGMVVLGIIEAVMHLLGASRIYFSLLLLNVDYVTFIDSLVYVGALVMGVVVVFAPSGLGVVESISGLLSLILEIDPQYGVYAAIINRVISFAILMVSVFLVMLIGIRKKTQK